MSKQMQWRSDADAVFAEAIGDGRDILLWWTAPWCPPCNELDFMVFSRPQFTAGMPGLHYLKIDADAPLAQRWGDRFGLQSYPSAWLLDPGGAPRLCLPMSTNVQVICDTIALAQRARPLAQIMEAIRAFDHTDADERRLVALHWWVQDMQLFAEPLAREAVLAAACEQACADPVPMRLRLLIHWLQAASQCDAANKRPALRDALLDLLHTREFEYADAYLLWVDLHQLLVFGTDLQPVWLAACIGAIERQLSDGQLLSTQRLIARHALLQALSMMQVDDDILRSERKQAASEAQHVAARCDPGEWISVTNMAGHLLQAAGDQKAAVAMFEDAITKAEHPGYFMQYLGDMALESGDVEGGLAWWRRVHQASRGHATRFSVGVRMAGRFMTHAPFDVDAVDDAVRAALVDLAATDTPTAGSNRRNMELLMQQLQAWRATSGRCDLGCDGALCA